MKISHSEITSTGILKLYYGDGTFIDVGKVTGDPGIDGQMGESGEQGTQGFRGEKGAKGEIGRPGLDGNSNSKTTLNSMDDTPDDYGKGKFLVGNSSGTKFEYQGILIGSGNDDVISSSLILGDGAGNQIFQQTSGSDNTLLGYQAGLKLSSNKNTFIGSKSGIGFQGTSFVENICIGYNSCVNALNASESIIIGTNTNLGKSAVSNGSIIIGNKSNINETYVHSNTGKCVILGYNSSIDSANSIIIGDNSISKGNLANDKNHLLVGFSNEINSNKDSNDNYGNTTTNGICIGNQCKIISDKNSTDNSINIGYKSNVMDCKNSIAIVLNTYDDAPDSKLPGVFSDNSIAIGNSARSSGISSISAGTFSNSSGNFSIAIGGSLNDVLGAQAKEKHSIAIGTGSNSEHENSICLGKNAVTDINNQFALADNIRNIKIGGINYIWPLFNNERQVNSILTIDDNSNLTWKCLNDNDDFKNSILSSYEHFNYILSKNNILSNNKIYLNKFFMTSKSKFSKVHLLINNDNEKIFNIKVGIYSKNEDNLPDYILSEGSKYIDSNVNNLIEIDLDSELEVEMNKEYFIVFLYYSQNSNDLIGLLSYENINDIDNVFINNSNEFSSLPNTFNYDIVKYNYTFWFRLIV